MHPLVTLLLERVLEPTLQLYIYLRKLPTLDLLPRIYGIFSFQLALANSR